MTAQDIINQADELVPNTIPREDKLRWVSEAEFLMYGLMGCPGPTDAGEDREIFDPFLWRDLYLHYLEMKISYFQRDISRYNQALTMYLSQYSDFRDFCNRTRRPAGSRIQYF